MELQDKRMCKTESGFSGVTVDYNHHPYDVDCLGDFLNIFDFPIESLEGGGFAEDWASKLGPIPSEVFKEIMPQGPQIGVANKVADLPFEYPLLNNRSSQIKYEQNGLDEEIFKDYQTGKISQVKQNPTFVEDKKLYPSQASPNSVLESSNNKGVSFGIEISIPV